MDIQQPRRRIPEVQFRVLIIGRKNAGKTSILKRVCETTESPVIYRGGREVTLDPSMDRGEHMIDDELVFSNHKGYIFHDSRGIESGGTEELQILQEFIRRKCGARRLGDRLHAIWYCVPMDNHRPELDLRFFNDICPDRNVPVIAVFTKFDQFRRNVQINVEDFGSPDDDVLDVAEKQFQEHYVDPLGDDVRFVRLEQMHKQSLGCDRLIEMTAVALNDDVVGLMLLDSEMQRGNLELSIKTALNRAPSHLGIEHIVRKCLIPFPHIWWFKEAILELEEEEFFFRQLQREQFLLEFERELFFSRFVKQIMSLPTIQNLTRSSLGGYHLILAVILILKHATLLRFVDMSPDAALTHAEVDYRQANIDSSIQQYLAAHSQEHSYELLTDFIVATVVTCKHIGAR